MCHLELATQPEKAEEVAHAGRCHCQLADTASMRSNTHTRTHARTGSSSHMRRSQVLFPLQGRARAFSVPRVFSGRPVTFCSVECLSHPQATASALSLFSLLLSLSAFLCVRQQRPIAVNYVDSSLDRTESSVLRDFRSVLKNKRDGHPSLFERISRWNHCCSCSANS